MSFKCNLCYFECNTHEILIDHTVRSHTHDPKFQVQCDECGITFSKWETFRKHVYRNHIEHHEVHNINYEEAAHENIQADVRQNENVNEGNYLMFRHLLKYTYFIVYFKIYPDSH